MGLLLFVPFVFFVVQKSDSPVVGGELESALDLVLLPLDQTVVEPGPLRVPGVKLFVRKFPRPGPPPRLGGEASQRARPPTPLVLVSVWMQAGKGVGDRAPRAEESGLGELFEL